MMKSSTPVTPFERRPNTLRTTYTAPATTAKVEVTAAAKKGKPRIAPSTRGSKDTNS